MATAKKPAPIKEAEAAKAPAQYIVKSPVQNFVGIGAGGVQFAYGKAVINEGWVLEWYREHGYEISEIPAEK